MERVGAMRVPLCCALSVARMRPVFNGMKKQIRALIRDEAVRALTEA